MKVDSSSLKKMSFSESDISLVLMCALVLERLWKYTIEACDHCSSRTKSCDCKSGCIEFSQRQRSDADLDIPRSQSSSHATTPSQTSRSLEEVAKRLQDVVNEEV